MRQQRALLNGRDDEVDELAGVLRAGGGAARVVLVSGGAGAGKSAVVEQACAVAVREGARVLRLDWAGAEGPAGAAALADAVCHVLAKIHDGRLPVRITAIRRVQLRAAGRGGEVALLSVVSEMLADAAQYAPFALIVDDIQLIPAETSAALGLLLRAFRPAGVPVVLAGRPVGSGRVDAARLPAAADRVLELAPLPPAEVGALITRRLGRPVEPALVTAVLRSLGPLAGNPAAVLSVLASLEERGGLLDIDGQICLTEPAGRLRLTTDAIELALRPPDTASDTASDADILPTAATLARLVEPAELRLDDLHRLRSLGDPDAEPLARTVRHLVRDHVLTVDGAGRMAFAVPALAATLRALPVSGDIPSLHARIVTSVTDRLGPAAAGSGYPRLAYHAGAAGPMLDDQLAVPLLLSAALGGGQADRPGTVHGCPAAMRRLPPDDSRTPDVLRRSVAVNLRYANHTGVLALGEPLLACLDGARDADRDALEQVARAWTLSALYEHRSPYAHDADPRYRAALEQVPDATALAALGWLYGIGPKASRPAPPTDRSPADGAPAVHSRPADARPACVPPANVPAAHVPGARTPAADRATDRAAGFGPVPSPAEVRLLAAALGSHAEFERARRDLPPNALSDAALDRLRNSASYGDLAGALKAVLGDRYVEAGHSTAVQYHAMVREYLAGHWDSALSIARHIETRGRSNPAVGVGQLARALAAEIQLMRGELAHARAWLDLVPDCVAHPLVVRTRLNARFFSAHSHEAVDLAWRELREVRDSGLLAGTERVLQPIMKIGALQNNPAAMRLALTEMEALHKEMASPMAREAVFFGWGMAHRDADSALIAHRLVRQRGDVPLGVFYSQCLADLSDDPGPWLAESVRDARALGYGRPVRLEMERSARRRNLSVPRHRNAPNGLSEQDVRLIEMVSDGSTNRQIAARLTCSEKTVEQRLTRLFQRTGSRSRTELAAAWLDGSLARQGLVPETGQHGAGRAWHLVRPGGLPPPER